MELNSCVEPRNQLQSHVDNLQTAIDNRNRSDQSQQARESNVLNDKDQRIESLSAELAEKAARNNEYRNSLGTKDCEIESLKNDLDDQCRQNEKLLRAQSTLQTEISELQTSLNGKDENVHGLEATLRQLTEEEIPNLPEEYEDNMRSECQSFNAKVESLSAELRSSGDSLTECKTENIGLQTKVEDLTT